MRRPRLKIPTLPEHQLFLLLALVIGIFAGLSVVLFRIAIAWSRWWLLGSGLQPPFPKVILAPALMGLAVRPSGRVRQALFRAERIAC